jgi:hypothetical protein
MNIPHAQFGPHISIQGALMSLSLTIGSNPAVSLDNLGDLENAANSTLLKLGEEFKDYLGGPISAVPADLNSYATTRAATRHGRPRTRHSNSRFQAASAAVSR